MYVPPPFLSPSRLDNYAQDSLLRAEQMLSDMEEERKKSFTMIDWYDQSSKLMRTREGEMKARFFFSLLHSATQQVEFLLSTTIVNPARLNDFGVFSFASFFFFSLFLITVFLGSSFNTLLFLYINCCETVAEEKEIGITSVCRSCIVSFFFSKLCLEREVRIVRFFFF